MDRVQTGARQTVIISEATSICILTVVFIFARPIVTAWDSRKWAMDDISVHYQTLCRYLNFKDQGMILWF